MEARNHEAKELAMGVMPAHIAKGTILERFDDFVNKKRSNLLAALAQYKTGDIWKAIEWAFLQSPQLLEKAELDHIVNHWFPEHFGDIPAPVPPRESPFWNTLRPLGPVFLAGLVRALELCEEDPATGIARAKPLPLDSYWVCTQTHFEMCATLGYAFDSAGKRQPHHVNLLILTPNPPIPRHHEPSGGFTTEEDIWIVQHSAIEPGSTPIGSPATGPVVTLRPKK